MGKKQQAEWRRKIFDCPQEDIFNTIQILYGQGFWPQGYHKGGKDDKSSPGDIRLGIEKERPLKQGEPKTFEAIGYITIGKINDRQSNVAVISNNPDLLRFFDELVKKFYPDGRVIPEDVKEKIQPWMDIPDIGYDRALVKLLYDGYTYPQIYEEKQFANEKRMRNRISELRKNGYTIHYQEEIKKMRRGKP